MGVSVSLQDCAALRAPAGRRGTFWEPSQGCPGPDGRCVLLGPVPGHSWVDGWVYVSQKPLPLVPPPWLLLRTRFPACSGVNADAPFLPGPRRLCVS